MKKQVVAKLNQIANEFDQAGLYVEANTLTNVMKKLAMDGEVSDDMPDSSVPTKEGKVIVQHTGDELDRSQSTYTVYVSIEGESTDEIRTFRDENGKLQILHDLDKANEIARSMRSKYPDVSFEIHLLQKRRPNPRFPGDPYDEYKDRNPYRNEDRGFRRRRRY